MNDALQNLVIKELEPLNLELFELRLGGTKGRPVLDVRIDRTDGERVTVDDCARASRAIEAKLDEVAFAGSRYVLEVSSPGVERPLRNAADFRRFAGREAVVTNDAVEGGLEAGSREVRITGVEGGDGEEIIVAEDASGKSLRIPMRAVRKARLAFNWKR
ncbi:MAG: ribosome maturation factor RimP [Gemmatimonadaceae bacterium]